MSEDNKKVDGIQKNIAEQGAFQDGVKPEKKEENALDKNEIKKSKKIVLDAIGEMAEEKFSKPKAENNFKKLDGILSKKLFNTKQRTAANKEEKRRRAEQKKRELKEKWRQEVAPQSDSSSSGSNKTNKIRERMLAAKKRASDKNRAVDKNKDNKQNNINFAKKFRDINLKELGGKPVLATNEKQETILPSAGAPHPVKADKQKKNTKLKTGASKQIKKRKKMQAQKEAMKNGESAKQRAVAKKARQARRRKRRQEMKINFLNFLSGLLSKSKIISGKSLNMIIILIIISILFYVVFMVLTLKFDMDNKISRRVAAFLPVPAFITKNGVIVYYEYKDIKTDLADNYQGHDLEEAVKLSIAREIAINSLREKYNLFGLNSGDLHKKLSEQAVFDDQINRVGLDRIKKIKQIIDKEGDFTRIAAKYGDKHGRINLNQENENLFNYARDVKKLAVGEVSDVIIAADGYYVFQCYEKADESVFLNYVFIKARSLDEYLEEEVKGFRMWSLVK